MQWCACLPLTAYFPASTPAPSVTTCPDFFCLAHLIWDISFTLMLWGIHIIIFIFSKWSIKYSRWGEQRDQLLHTCSTQVPINHMDQRLVNCFWCSLWAYNGFYIFQGMGEKSQKKSNISWSVKVIWHSNFSVCQQCFTRTEPCLFVFICIVCGCFLQQQCWVIVTRAVWPTKSKVLPI